jgi:hypothetical protein
MMFRNWYSTSYPPKIISFTVKKDNKLSYHLQLHIAQTERALLQSLQISGLWRYAIARKRRSLRNDITILNVQKKSILLKSWKL